MLDLQGDKGFGRLTYENGIDGLEVSYSQRDKFVDNLPNFYADSLTPAAPKKTINTGQFYGDRDVLVFDGTVTGKPPLAQLVMSIQSVYVGSLEFKDTAEKLDSRSISFEDRILSARAGALMAHSTFTIQAPATGAASSKTISSIAANIAAPTGSAEAAFARSLNVLATGGFPLVARKLDLRTSEKLVDSGPLSTLPTVEFIRLPPSKSDLDFNRLFVQAQSIVDTNVLVTSFDETNKAISKDALYRMKDALEALSADSTDREAMSFVREQTQILSGPAGSPLILYRSIEQTGAPPSDITRTQNFLFRYSTVDKFRQALRPSMTPEQISKFENDAATTAIQSISSLVGRPLPHDHALLIGTVSDAQFGKAPWMNGQDQVFGLHPAVLSGSIQAKVLALAAESMIISSVRANKRKVTAVEYLPALRRLQQQYQARSNSTFSSMLASSAPSDTGLLRDIAGFNSFGALYSYGFANFASHVDTTDYRLGLEQGQFEGGKAVYDLLKSKLTFVNLNDLPDGASIDDILKAIEQAAESITKFVQGLQQLVDQLKNTVASLEQKLASTLSDVGGAARGIRTLALAGTGFLIGGPVGAAIGGLISLF
ncbi:hypothetical protein EAS56_17670 [Bradyrhizobium guangzhouense]|uniref:Uncharacterized protein n=1 Tax=Bradyrhizobium guangzhouense TaxID=1325095 RepID=A0ABY0E7N6_9BRAD|nr:hypothetical protein EAS56_17670 [Bradyrhizobium guangzhouense]